MSKIEWTEERKAGLKRFATMNDMDPEKYVERHQNGEKYCSKCQRWLKPEDFNIDRSRWDNRHSICQECRKRAHRKNYEPKQSTLKPGPNRKEPEDGNRKQANKRINHDVENCQRPHPNNLHCAFCGHKGDDKRHEYHHHMGYGKLHHYDVLPLCTECHREVHENEQNEN